MIDSMTMTPSNGTPLQIHSATGSPGIFLKNPIEGLEQPNRRVGSYEKPGEDGGRVTSMLHGNRVVTLRGFIQASTVATHEQLRQDLSEAARIVRDANGFPELTLFEFTTSGGEDRQFEAAIQSLVFSADQLNFSEFQMVLLVPEPYISGTDPISVSGIQSPAGGGFVLPVILPIVFASDSGGSQEVENVGTAVTWPVLTISGISTNPYIRNATTGKSFQLTYPLVEGDEAIIDMKEKTVLINGGNGIPYKTSESEWIWLEPGLNTIEFVSGSDSDTGELSVNAYPKYLAGV